MLFFQFAKAVIIMLLAFLYGCISFHQRREIYSSPFKLPNRGTESSNSNESSTRTHDGNQYMPIEDVEKLERYRPGGYHPMAIVTFMAVMT